MADEIGSAVNFDEAGGWWKVRENLSKVTEEAVKRVQDDQQKAKQVGQQIQADHATNVKLAQFLSFLIKVIKDDKVIKGLYDTFFKIKHPETNIVYIRKSVNTLVIVGMFAPFYAQEAKKEKIDGLFNDLYDAHAPLSLSSYVHYLKKLSAKYHDNVPLDKSVFIKFLVDVVSHYGLIATSKLTNQEYADLQQSISKELYWH